MAYQSGQFSRARKRSACSKPFRNANFQFAGLSTQREPWAADYYARKRGEGMTHTMAVRVLGTHWLRIIHSVISAERLVPSASAPLVTGLLAGSGAITARFGTPLQPLPANI